MSRVGKMPITVPKGVDVSASGEQIVVKGALGTLSRQVNPLVTVKLEDGKGAVIVWDRGAYEQGGRVAWPEALERGHAVFVLHGEKLRGGFALQRTRGEGEKSQWLLLKRKDEAAQPESDVVGERPESVRGGSTLVEVIDSAG